MSYGDENDGPRWPHLHWEWLVVGVVLFVFPFLILPRVIEVLQTPGRSYGFEADLNRKFIYASPIVILAGAWMVRRAFSAKRSFQFSIAEMLIAIAGIAVLCGIVAM